MSVYLGLRDPGVRTALRHKALKGLPRLGRGAFCAVYDKGDTVLKLTADPVSYEFAAGIFRPQGEHFPRLVEDYFCVGETADEEPLYLFEVEKLRPIRRDSLYHIKRTAKDMCRQVDQTYCKHRMDGLLKRLRRTDADACRMALEEMANDTILPEGIRGALGEVAQFAGNFEAVADFHTQNLMLRGDTIVLNDVVVGEKSLEKLRKYCW